MSRVFVASRDWTKSDLDTSRRRVDLLYNPQSQSCDPRSQRPRCTPPATPSSAHVLSTNITAHFLAATGSSRPCLSEAGDRLPGVQQLLLPHSTIGSAQSTSFTSDPWGESHQFSRITISPLSKCIPPPSTKTPETNVKAPLPGSHNSILTVGQRFESNSLDTNRAFNNKRRDFEPATTQALPCMSSPPLSRYSVFQTNRSPCGSPESNNTNQQDSYATYARQPNDLRDVNHVAPAGTYASLWRTTHHVLDWGTTKAGNPRKRLAQACLSCRQKKIRCYPNPTTMKCFQCEKSGGRCKYESGYVVNKAKMLSKG